MLMMMISYIVNFFLKYVNYLIIWMTRTLKYAHDDHISLNISKICKLFNHLDEEGSKTKIIRSLVRRKIRICLPGFSLGNTIVASLASHKHATSDRILVNFCTQFSFFPYKLLTFFHWRRPLHGGRIINCDLRAFYINVRSGSLVRYSWLRWSTWNRVSVHLVCLLSLGSCDGVLGPTTRPRGGVVYWWCSRRVFVYSLLPGYKKNSEFRFVLLPVFGANREVF